MREAFTQTLATAIRLADEQARQLRQEFVGTEHLLLGILAASQGEAVRALKSETNVDELHEKLMQSLPRATVDPMVTGRLPLSPNAQQAINAAIAAAQANGLHSISTRLLMQALLSDADSAIRRSLLESGADIDELARILGRSNIETEP